MKRAGGGFTISELLLVIVVISILAAMAVMTYNGIQARAQLARAQWSLNVLAKSAETYAIEHDQGRPASQAAFINVFKAASLYESTRDPNGQSFAICALPQGYVIVAWNPIVTSYKNGDMLYTYSAMGGQQIVMLTNSSLSALPNQIDKVCDEVYPITKNNGSAFTSWSYNL